MYHNNPMKMVGHDDGGVNGNTVVPRGQRFPRLPNHAAKRTAPHLTVRDLAKQRIATLGAQGDEIHARDRNNRLPDGVTNWDGAAQALLAFAFNF